MLPSGTYITYVCDSHGRTADGIKYSAQTVAFRFAADGKDRPIPAIDYDAHPFMLRSVLVTFTDADPDGSLYVEDADRHRVDWREHADDFLAAARVALATRYPKAVA